MSDESEQRTTRIQQLNDRFRSTFEGGRIVITAGVQALGLSRVRRLLSKVRTFDSFDADNDPHGEHDFGAFVDDWERFFWKIDYYDLNVEYGSEDPANPKQTTRVLTLMLADEY